MEMIYGSLRNNNYPKNLIKKYFKIGSDPDAIIGPVIIMSHARQLVNSSCNGYESQTTLKYCLLLWTLGWSLNKRFRNKFHFRGL